MKLTLHPDPGAGKHWRLTLEVASVELSCDVAGRDEPTAALAEAHRVAEAIGLVVTGLDEWGPA